MRRPLPPFETTITGLGPKGTGLATGPEGQVVHVRGGAPGATVSVVVTARKRGVVHARRVATRVPPPDAVRPRCAVFGTCGGCTLQELPLHVQRRHKQEAALREIGDGLGDPSTWRVHPVRGTDAAYGYRNKVELTFGRRRWLTDEEQAAGVSAEGLFLGFHAPGRFDRVVDTERCELVSEAANAVLAVVRAHLREGPAPWDPHTHTGWWRHLLLREHGGERLVALFTGSAEHPDRVERLQRALAPHATAFRWYVNAAVADVARGELARAWGPDHLLQPLGDVAFEVGTTSFFQTNTAATAVLYATIGEAAGTGGRLLDLYCGSGSIGQTLRGRFDALWGIEENPEAVEDARRNAARNGVVAEYHAGRVEALLDRVACDARDVIVVDPPRVGLHPKVADHVAALPARVLVYVACNPASLAADGPRLRAHGWRCTDLYTVDLFPQTGHVEVVARFER